MDNDQLDNDPIGGEDMGCLIIILIVMTLMAVSKYT